MPKPPRPHGRTAQHPGTGISGERCLSTIEHLSALGVRFAGTSREQQAADWIESEFRRLGLSQVTQLPFPCQSFEISRCTLELSDRKGDWKSVDAEPAAHSLATPSGYLEAKLVVLEHVPPTIRECKHLIGGRAVLIYNSLLFRLEAFKRLMSSGPAALLAVDDRFPNDWTIGTGIPGTWIELISCPLVNIPYTIAWEAVKNRVEKIRLDLTCKTSDATSQNVIGEVEGQSLPEEVIVVSGHHDSVLNNPGPDDNLTGVAAVLELARYFRENRPERTLRFISFGTEEQLSEGARHYVLGADDLGRIGFTLNIDAVSSWMGLTNVYCVGTRALPALIRQVNRDTGFHCRINREISPFSDHFPLNLAGIPGVWYYRTTFAAEARHFHHSALETLEVVSPLVLERTVRHQAALVERIANEHPSPVPRSIPKGQMATLRRMAREWCRMDELPS